METTTNINKLFGNVVNRWKDELCFFKKNGEEKFDFGDFLFCLLVLVIAVTLLYLFHYLKLKITTYLNTNPNWRRNGRKRDRHNTIEKPSNEKILLRNLPSRSYP